ncbi:MAG: cell envelope integrity protein TolA, partial [Pseudomonadota bacterium]
KRQAQLAEAQARAGSGTQGSGTADSGRGSGASGRSSAANRYVAAIREKIERNWQRPPGITESLSCELQVKLFPGGGVAHAQVIRSSGMEAFDRSAVNAVHRADPLPVPRGNEFDLVRNLRLIFYPDEIR